MHFTCISALAIEQGVVPPLNLSRGIRTSCRGAITMEVSERRTYATPLNV
jgi:hypothetical protein